MKNLLNIALVALVLIVLGCKCQQALDEMKNASSSPSPSPSASASPSASPSATKSDDSKSNSTTNSSKSDSSSSTGVSKASFDKIKVGMTRSEVNDIIGFEGTELTSSKGGGKVFSSYKWEGKGYSIITAVFEDDVLTNKYEANLK